MCYHLETRYLVWVQRARLRPYENSVHPIWPSAHDSVTESINSGILLLLLKLILCTLFCFQQPLLDSTLDSAPPHTFPPYFLSLCLHPYLVFFSSLLFSPLSPQFPAAVGFRWMVPTVQDPDLWSSDWLSQCPVVVLPEHIPKHCAHSHSQTSAHTQGYKAIG